MKRSSWEIALVNVTRGNTSTRYLVYRDRYLGIGTSTGIATTFSRWAYFEKGVLKQAQSCKDATLSPWVFSVYLVYVFHTYALLSAAVCTNYKLFVRCCRSGQKRRSITFRTWSNYLISPFIKNTTVVRESHNSKS